MRKIAISLFWTICVCASFVFAVINGSAGELGTAAMQGAAAAVELCISAGGMICLWSGIMELMRRAGMLASLTRALRPLLGRMFPTAASDEAVFSSLCANVAANLLGLGNAATPAGIEAAKGINRLSPDGRELCRLVVMNTASIQLLPTTVAAVRAAAGCQTPFDILPCVWLASICSVAVGLAVSWLLSGRRT